jgi:myo-inositol-1(or 4)-monophosphatase
LRIIEILKTAALEVLNETQDLIGQPEAAVTFGRGAGGDLSSKLDLVAENAVLDVIKKSEFKPTVIGEECGIIEGKDGYLIMDAVDGTTNAIRGIPFSCCSLAYAAHGRLSSVSDAVIVDLSRGDVYESTLNNGAFMNGTRLRIKDSTKGRDSNDLVIGVNVSGLSCERFEEVSRIISRFLHIRHLGANALELAFLTRNLIDVYIDLRDKIRVTDMAAAFLIVREAGGMLFTPQGEYLDFELSLNERMSFMAAKNKEFLHLLQLI